MTKRLLVSMGLMALAVMLLTAGTLALFTAEVSNEGNNFQTGTLTIADITNGNGSAAINVTNIAPGDNGIATFTIQNTGNLDAWVRIGDMVGSGDLFAGDYPIELTDYTGVLRINAGNSANFEVKWDFSSAAGNEYQGKSGSFEVHFDAVQYKNNEGPFIDW